VEDERRAKEEAVEGAAAAERRGAGVLDELEELRSQLETAERARKAADSKLNDAQEQITELSSSVNSLTNVKRKLENDIVALQVSMHQAWCAAVLRVARVEECTIVIAKEHQLRAVQVTPEDVLCPRRMGRGALSDTAIRPSVCLFVRLSVCPNLSYSTLAACSWPATRDVRTADRSADGRRSAAS